MYCPKGGITENIPWARTKSERYIHFNGQERIGFWRKRCTYISTDVWKFKQGEIQYFVLSFPSTGRFMIIKIEKDGYLRNLIS
jgi:hypothetical protein